MSSDFPKGDHSVTRTLINKKIWKLLNIKHIEPQHKYRLTGGGGLEPVFQAPNLTLIFRSVSQHLFSLSVLVVSLTDRLQLTTLYRQIKRMYRFQVTCIPVIPHLYSVKLGYIGVYLLLFIFYPKHPRRDGSNVYPQSMSPRTLSIVQIIFSFWSFEISGCILRN